MSEVRVFELAKELNMPAKQLLTKMRKAGIPVTGNFSEQSLEQAEIVREMAKTTKGIIFPKGAKANSSGYSKTTAKDFEEQLDSKQDKPNRSTSIVTISTKSILNSEITDDAPKRRVRRKKKNTENVTTGNKFSSKEKTTAGVLDNNDFSGDNLEAEKKTRMEAEYSAEEKTSTPNLRELQTVSTAEEVVLENIKETPAVLDTRKKNLEKITGGVTRKTFDTDKDTPDDEDKKSKKKKVVFKQNQVLEDLSLIHI